MLISDNIARIIEQMIEGGGGSAEIRRNDLAATLGCVPSQITYVLSSRFTPERGYLIESRRGGGGYIRIVRKQMSRSEYLMHFFHAIGDSIDEGSAAAYIRSLADVGIVSAREAAMIGSALSGSALSRIDPAGIDHVRADILRHIVLSLMS